MLTYNDVMEREDTEEFRFIRSSVTDQWRWGYWIEFIYQRKEDGKYFAFDVQLYNSNNPGAPNDGLWGWEDIPPHAEVKLVMKPTFVAV